MVAALIMSAAIKPRPIFVKTTELETESVKGLNATAKTGVPAGAGVTVRSVPRYSLGTPLLAHPP